jgi:hypothetical protein
MKGPSIGTIVAGASCALIVACAGGSGDTSSPLRPPTSVSRVLTSANVGDPGDGVVNEAEVELCSHGSAAQFDVVVDGAPAVTYSLALDECRVVAVNLSTSVNSTITVSEVSNPSSYTLQGILRTDLAFIVGTLIDDQPMTSTTSDPVSITLNHFHGVLLEYTNQPVAPPPPPPVCDFITFGRLVALVNGQKVVISGNIGGNQPGGGILSEFHVVANGIDNHVADVATYGAISSGPLSNLTNSRISTGIAKNGVAVEVRMWDGGEPGKGTDIVYVKLDGVEILGPNGQYLDQGNMQYHSNCRGPG